jgi:hypothetical protein
VCDNTTPLIKALIADVFGRDAAATVAYRPGAAMDAARPTDREQNTYSHSLKTVIRQTMGNRAAAVFTAAEILTLPLDYQGETMREGRKWTKAQLTTLKAKFPKA